LTKKTWEKVDLFESDGYYDKIITTLRIIDRGGSQDEVFSFFQIDDPGKYKDTEHLNKDYMQWMLRDVCGFVDISGDAISLTENGQSVLSNHKSSLIEYNKQVIFLYFARNVGGFLNVFYSLRGEEPDTRETIMDKVNQERKKSDLKGRSRWWDFSVRLEWMKELGLVMEEPEGSFKLTDRGINLFRRMQKKGTDAEQENREDSTTVNQYPEEYRDRISGPLKKRRYGIRIDDDVIVYIVGGDTLRIVEGRVLRHKRGLHLIDDEGYYHRISYDWVTDIVIKTHNRPHPNDDKEFSKKKKTTKSKDIKVDEPKNLENVYL